MTDEIICTSKKFGGNYKGVNFEVVNWNDNNQTFWNYYIFVSPRDIINGSGYVDEHSMYGDVQFHCEITFFQEIRSSNYRIIHKIGCDYSHLCDLNIVYNLDDILIDVKQTIDTLPPDLILTKENIKKWRPLETV